MQSGYARDCEYPRIYCYNMQCICMHDVSIDKGDLNFDDLTAIFQ